jgi:hypothetical protein
MEKAAARLLLPFQPLIAPHRPHGHGWIPLYSATSVRRMSGDMPSARPPEREVTSSNLAGRVPESGFAMRVSDVA